MPKTTNVLDKELAKIKKSTANFLVVQRVTREKERKIMSAVYMWWKQARQLDGYLEGCYSKYNIQYNKISSGVNFRPLLRLVSNNEMPENDLLTWSRAYEKINEEVETSPQHYDTDGADKVAHFIAQKGGKIALAGYHSKTKPKTFNEDYEPVSESMFFKLDEKEFLPLLQTESRNYYGTAPKLNSIAIPTPKTTADGYSIVLVRNDGHAVNLIASVDDAKLVDQLLIDAYLADFEALPATMRSILEIVHITNVPKVLAGSHEKFIEYSNLKDGWHEGKKEPAFKRLIYRPSTGDFLSSCLHTPSSVVVTAKPLFLLIERDVGDVFLPISNRQSIETRLLHQSLFNLFTTDSTSYFETVGATGFGAHTLRIRSKLQIQPAGHVTQHMVVRHTENLNHPSITFIPFYEMLGKPRWQVDLKAGSFIKTWSTSVDINWLRKASNEFVDGWIAAYGKKSNRHVNNTVQVKLSGTALTIGYEFDKESGFDNAKSIDLPLESTSGEASLIAKSVDFIFVMRQLSDLNIVGAIVIAADAYAINFHFSTNVNSYQVTIPAANKNGQRSSKHLASYNPSQSVDPTTNYEPDDDEPDMTAAEKQQLEKKLERMKNRVKSN